ncbi:MAG: TonB family protein [Terriglobales bacterium]
MGYQALLFCADEKLASVVRQVFSELDFTIEAVQEPFAAVKKLMSQRYDAVVIDSENEQNASLLFKSARNSSSNQGSLAIALVEGQAGVTRAYRIGANLVLTKPINVEQARGTLRVARGLLRKNSDAAAGAVATVPAGKTTPTSASSSSQPSNPTMPPNQPNRSDASEQRQPATMAPPSNHRPVPQDVPEAAPEFAASQPTTIPLAAPVQFPQATASTKVEEKPVAAPTPAAQSQNTITPATTAELHLSASPGTNPDIVRNEVVKSLSGSAAAPAPAKEVNASPARKSTIFQAETAHFDAESDAAAIATSLPAVVPAPSFSSGTLGSTPSFAALGEEDSGGSGGIKKILVVAAAVLVLAALGYFGYDKLSKPSATLPPQHVSAPQDSAQPASALKPMPSPVAALSKPTPDQSSSTTQLAVSKTAITLPPGNTSAGETNIPVIRVDATPDAKKAERAPIHVNLNGTAPRKKIQDEESSPVPPTIAPADNSNLGGLVSSVSVDIPKPAFETMRISQGVSQGLLIKRVTPKYPQSALATHASGAVLIEATIDKEGNVTNLKVLKGDPTLARAALEAVRQWRYKPYYLDGAPVEIQTEITVNFKAN